MFRRQSASVVFGVILPLALFAAALLPSRSVFGAAQAKAPPQTQGRGLSAIDTAARNNKYLFIFFWKANDQQSQSMYGVFQSTMKKWAKSVDSIGVNITDPREKPVVDKFGVSRAPMPLVLALAPNGAIT
ncbi:MAG: hypothetical protein ACYSWU_15660, partial [Planctomycetota bacterium]